MLLKLTDIKKQYVSKKGVFLKQKSFVKAVDGVDLAIKSGENLSLIGESGCGKTTLARLIMRLEDVDSGSINFDGNNVTHKKGRALEEFRKNIHMVFQDPYSSLDPRFTIREILKEAMIIDRKSHGSKAQQQETMVKVLESVDLKAEMLQRFPHEFSGGERQRIAIARALILSPKLLILDEAVSSLDVITQAQIIKLLNELQKKYDVTYLFISHNLKIVRKITHNIAVMYQGKIVELASAYNIFNNPLHKYTQELLQAAIEYKAVERDEEIQLPENGRLVEHDLGHFVYEG